MLLSCKFLVVTLSHMSIISRIKIRTMNEMDFMLFLSVVHNTTTFQYDFYYNGLPV